MIADRPIEQITRAELERLISNGVAESRTLEYKEALSGGTDQDKRAFLADVSSFANAIGGDLVFGARERRDENGKPIAVAAKAGRLFQRRSAIRKSRRKVMSPPSRL